MVASQLKLLQIQFASEFTELINPGLERSEITNHSPAAFEISEISFTRSSIIDNVNCNREHSEQLHLDRPPAPQVKPRDHLETMRLLHVPIRLAHFDPILKHPNLQHSDALLTPLATFSCVSASRSGNKCHIDDRTTQSPRRAILDDIVLECAFCNTSISLANFFARANNNAKLTMELLETLATEHAVWCTGRNGVDLMNADDAQFGVSEGESEHKPITNTFINENWSGSIKALEEVKLLFANGLLIHTHPELFQAIISKLPVLTPDRLRNAIALFWLSPEAEQHAPFGQLPHPRLTALNYFFVQTPPDQSGPQPVQIRYADAIRRIHQVHYDRGNIVNAMDIEAKEMADCRKRYDSFSKSELLRGKVAAYQLSQLGFFFVGDRNSRGKLRCSFCRRTIHMFTTEDAPYLEKDFDRRLIALLHRHSHLSATCPFTVGLNGDDKYFSADDIARVVEPFIRMQFVQLAYTNLCSQPSIDSAYLRIFAASIISLYPNGLPPLDGDMSNAYNNAIAELDYELFSSFEPEPDFESELSVVDDLTTYTTPIDYLIGVQQKYSNYKTLQSRIDSFDVDAWLQHPISRTNSPLLTPESFAQAGFYYSGTADNVMCFWCGLGLNHWEATDDPVSEHVRFTLRCTWLLRSLGRQRVKYVYLKANGNPVETTAVQNIKPTDYAFIRDVDDIAGGLDQEHLCSVDYRTELREAKARLDLPAHWAIIDEFGYSLDLLLHALESQLKETGNDFASAQQLLECLWAYEGWKTEKVIDSDADFVARAEELRRHAADSLVGTNTSSATTGVVPAPAATQQTGSAQESLCVVCMSAARSVVLIPCGHLAVCQSCYSRLQQCPICLAVIRGAIRSYLS